MKSVGEHTIRFLCTEQSVWLKNTHVKREKENGRSIWRALLLLRLVIFNCFFLQNFRARQFLKSSRVVSMWTYFKLSSLEKDWYSLQNFPYVVVNIRLILGNVWLKGYTWWNARIFQRPPQKKKKKIPLWEWKEWLMWFSVLIKFKIQEQTRKWLFRSFSIMLDRHRTKPENTKQTKKKTNKQNNKRTTTKKNHPGIHYSKVLWSLPLGKLLVMQSWWGQLAFSVFSA